VPQIRQTIAGKAKRTFFVIQKSVFRRDQPRNIDVSNDLNLLPCFQNSDISNTVL